MSMDFLFGVMRLAPPLFCVGLAALWYRRIGITNICLDGQIAVAAIGYVLGTHTGIPGVAVAFAVGSALLVGVLLVISVDQWKLDGLLVGLGSLYFCYSFAPFICHIFAGNPGYAQIRGAQFSERFMMIAPVVLCVTVVLAQQCVRSIRVAKVIGDSTELTEIQGISVSRQRHFHNVVASVLIAMAAAYLVEHAGSYTTQISGGRGFLALALVAIGGGSLNWILALSLLFAFGQKTSYAVSRSGELFEALPYLLALILLCLAGLKRKTLS